MYDFDVWFFVLVVYVVGFIEGVSFEYVVDGVVVVFYI